MHKFLTIKIIKQRLQQVFFTLNNAKRYIQYGF